MYAEEERLRDFLLDAGLLSRSQLDTAVRVAEESDRPLSSVLLDSGALGEDEMRRAVARGLGVPFVRFTPDELSPEALALVPEPLARAHTLVATRLADGVLEVALLDIADLTALAPLRLHTKYKVVPRLTDRESMTRALLHYQKHLKEQFGARIARDAGEVAAADVPADLEAAAERLPVRSAVDALIGHALYQSASAVHLEPREAGLLIRYRIGTVLYDAMHVPGAAAPAIALRLKLLAHLQLDTTAPQEGRFRVAVGDGGDSVSIRVSTMLVAVGAVVHEKVVLHLMHEQAGKRGFTLESLGFTTAAREHVHEALAQARGLVLVCGPAHAGKTTLLYTLLDMLGGSGRSIASVEERVEMYLPFVSQTTLAPEVGLDFAPALRAALRQDADVVMVSDINDHETAALALEAANRGVLVLAGIDAPSAAAGIATLQRLEVPPLVLASTLRVAIGTRVVRKLCPHKQEQRRLSRGEADALEAQADFGRVLASLKAEGKIDTHALWKDMPFYRAEPCAECLGGYRGYLGLQEVLRTSEVLKELLSRELEVADIEAQAREEGMLVLAEDGIAKAAQGLTTIEEVLSVAASD